MPKNQLSERISSTVGSLQTIYITHKLAYELFLVLQAVGVNLFQTQQYGVPILILPKFNLQAFFLFLRPTLVAVGQ